VPKLAANLSMLYPDLSFLDRFEAAARDGFKAVEFLFPYSFSTNEIADRLTDNNLQLVLFNAPPGGVSAESIEQAWAAGARGSACIAGKRSELEQGMRLALTYARDLKCPRVHLMAGLLDPQADRGASHATYLEHVGLAAKMAQAEGVDLMIEPINTRDIPGFYLNHQEQAHDVIQVLGLNNIKVQMDLYHCQIVQGDLAHQISKYLPTGRVGHFQIAGVPQRHEPDVGEINFPFLFELIDQLGYNGWIGCEYRPKAGVSAGGTTQGLAWAKPYL
jgi:2-dehydrotetronate isomerase